jgi:AraC family transcriptional regulator
VDANSLSTAVLESLEDPEALDRLYQSRSSFFRLFQALIEESPGAMRRRLLLERAAWQLSSTKLSVTEIALDANYGSLEAFTRAFRRAFLISPSLYRRTGYARIHLPAPNHFHFLPGKPGAPEPIGKEGATKKMDLFDLFDGTESWYTRRLLQQATLLSDEQLDRAVHGTAKVFGWNKPDHDLREILERMVQTKEVWTAAITGGEMPKLEDVPADDRTPAALLDRFEKADAEFHRVLKDVRDRGAWDDTFVDALCEPPETFTFGGMFAHVITFNSYRRLAALDAFDQLGVKIQGYGCPMDYEASIAARS